MRKVPASSARRRPRQPGRPLLVTSAHLAASYPELSAFEFGLIVAWHAFGRWMTRCMAVAADRKKDLATLDILVLHHVHHRGTPKRVADVCFVLDIEDTHVVAYSLRKLAAARLVQGEKRGKEVFYSTTTAGRALCARYKQVRDGCLVPDFTRSAEEAERLADIAQFLRGQASAYDQASRAAAVSLGDATARPASAAEEQP